MRRILFSKTVGLNNSSHPLNLEDVFRAEDSSKNNPGKTELSHTRGCGVDRTGRVFSFPGKEAIDAESWHSLFSHGGSLYGVRGESLVRVVEIDPLDFFEISSGFSDKVDYASVNDDIYLTSVSKNGFIRNGEFLDWPVSEYDRITDRVFSGPILSSNICFHLARIFLSSENFLFYSEPFGFSFFDYGRNYIGLPSTVVDMLSIDGALLAATTSGLYEITGGIPSEFAIKRIVNESCKPGCLSSGGRFGGNKVDAWFASDAGVFVKIGDKPFVLISGHIKLFTDGGSVSHLLVDDYSIFNI